MKGFTGGKDVDQAILEAADDETLLKLLQVNKHLLLVGDRAFRDRMTKRYPVLASLKPDNMTWSKYYLSMTYYLNKIKEKYNIDYIDVSSFEPAGFLKMLDYNADFLNYSIAKHMAEVIAQYASETGDVKNGYSSEISKLLENWIKDPENVEYKSFVLAFLLKYKNIALFEKLYEDYKDTELVRSINHPRELTEQYLLFLETAAESGDIDVVNYMLEKIKGQGSKELDNKRLSLALERGAAKSGSVEMLNYVRNLLEKSHIKLREILVESSRKGNLDFLKTVLKDNIRKRRNKVISILPRVIDEFILAEYEDVINPTKKEAVLRLLLETYLSLGGQKRKIDLYRQEIMDRNVIKILDNYGIPLKNIGEL